MKRISLSLTLILSFSFFSQVSAYSPNIKVRIAKNLKNISVSGLDLKANLPKTSKNFQGRKKLKFNCKNFSKNKSSGSKPLLLASLNSKSGLINWSGQKFKGQLQVLASNGHQSCDLVNNVSIEDYISSLLSREMNSKWPIEALKAQAIAARSYAWFMMKSRRVSRELGSNAYYDLESSEKHQVTGDFFDQTPSTQKATKQTKGYILVSKEKNQKTPIFFHSKCGGRTLRPDQVWDNPVAGYQSVNCPFCYNHGKKSWRYKISNKRMRKILKQYAQEEGFTSNSKKIFNKEIRMAPDKEKSNILRFYDGDKLVLFRKSYLRKKMGRARIPGNYLKVFKRKNSFFVYGEGNGHGVGMCQFGALDMAQKGKSYRQILAHYFPGHKLKKIY